MASMEFMLAIGVVAFALVVLRAYRERDRARADRRVMLGQDKRRWRRQVSENERLLQEAAAVRRPFSLPQPYNPHRPDISRITAGIITADKIESGSIRGDRWQIDPARGTAIISKDDYEQFQRSVDALRAERDRRFLMSSASPGLTILDATPPAPALDPVPFDGLAPSWMDVND